LIWSPVLPALGIFEDIALWRRQGVVDGEQRLVPVSVADIVLVLVIALIATAAAKDLPALLEILEQAAREHEHVLEDPAPLITFEGFGDNALTRVLRCY
jgi:small-conductance mechanosensitive channel